MNTTEVAKEVTTKVCTKCGEEKPLEEFTKNKANKSGLNNMCKVCISIMGKVYRKNNLEKIHEKIKIWKQNNPEKTKQYVRNWYETNKEKHNAHRKELNRKKSKVVRFPITDNNTKVCKECLIEKPVTEFSTDSNMKFGISNCCKQCNNARTTNWKNAHRELIKENSKKHYRENLEERRKNNRENIAKLRAKRKQQV